MDKGLRDMFDLKIFVDADWDVAPLEEAQEGRARARQDGRIGAYAV